MIHQYKITSIWNCCQQLEVHAKKVTFLFYFNFFLLLNTAIWCSFPASLGRTFCCQVLGRLCVHDKWHLLHRNVLQQAELQGCVCVCVCRHACVRRSRLLQSPLGARLLCFVSTILYSLFFFAFQPHFGGKKNIPWILCFLNIQDKFGKKNLEYIFGRFFFFFCLLLLFKSL